MPEQRPTPVRRVVSAIAGAACLPAVRGPLDACSSPSPQGLLLLDDDGMSESPRILPNSCYLPRDPLTRLRSANNELSPSDLLLHV